MNHHRGRVRPTTEQSTGLVRCFAPTETCPERDKFGRTRPCDDRSHAPRGSERATNTVQLRYRYRYGKFVKSSTHQSHLTHVHKYRGFPQAHKRQSHSLLVQKHRDSPEPGTHTNVKCTNKRASKKLRSMHASKCFD